MLKVENVKKEYKKGEIVLKDINVIFNDKEFVSVLGSSGSGKSTFLNIISGLDNVYEGEIYLNGENISHKRNSYYDKFHNQIIGFVHQDYNLLENYTVYKNIELQLIISKQKNKKEKVLKVLKEVNMLKHKNKKVKSLSGGEKQRIAIARSLVNDPDIILLDEPTGALDSKTSIEIMKLLKQLAKDKLIIMVTHNKDLAQKYSTRIITIEDGILKEDTNPNIVDIKKKNKKLYKTGINFLNTFLLGLKNLKSKPLRNILTLIGFTISLIGLSLVFSISTGFTKQIDNLKDNILSNYPIVINSKQIKNKNNDNNKIYKYETSYKNNINNELITYLDNINENKILGITYNYNYNFNVITHNNDSYKYSSNLPFIAIPDDNNYLKENYKLLSGRFPKDNKEVLIKVNNDNQIEDSILELFDIDKKEIKYEDILNKEIKIVLNNELYKEINNLYYLNSIDKELYENKNNITLTIIGIIKSKDTMEFNTLVNEDGGAVYYKNNLIEDVININSNSSIIQNQKKQNYSVFTKEKINEKEKENLLTSLGNIQNPFIIYIYPKDYNSKKYIVNYIKKIHLNNYGLEYNDLSDQVIKSFKTIIFGITTILIIFSFISLIVTLILIIVITYTSVLERKKEIGILRSLGTPKRDIRKLFIKETIIISIISSLLSISAVKILIEPLNRYLKSLTDLNDLMIFNENRIILVFLISIIVSILGSIIPAYKISVSNIIKNLK